MKPLHKLEQCSSCDIAVFYEFLSFHKSILDYFIVQFEQCVAMKNLTRTFRPAETFAPIFFHFIIKRDLRNMRRTLKALKVLKAFVGTETSLKYLLSDSEEIVRN